MSSTYDLVCLSHDPGLRLGLHLAQPPQEPVWEGHPYCDMVAVRVSGAPVEVLCLSTHDHRMHSDVVRLDVNYLRALYAMSRAIDSEDMPDATRAFLASGLLPATQACWTRNRLHSLRSVLDPENEFRPPR